MFKRTLTVVATLALTAGIPASGAHAQEASKSSANAAAIAKMDAMKGVWKGTAKGFGPGGVPFEVTQTERIGNMLGGDIIVIEGRGYKADGSLAFNAFGVISWNPQTSAYEFRAYNGGYSGTFKWTLTDTGAIWEMPAGPNANIVSTITLKDNTWHEVQQYVMQGQPGRTIVDMTLTRQGDTDWPLNGYVRP